MAANQPKNIPILTDVITAHERKPDEPDEPNTRASSPQAAALVVESGDTPAAADLEAAPPLDTAPARSDNETLIAELQTRLASATFALTEESMRAAFAEMEAKLHRQISERLRRELPELVDSLLREHLDTDRDG